MNDNISRRTVTKAAWTAPVIVAMASVPAYAAASGTNQVTLFAASCEHDDHHLLTINLHFRPSTETVTVTESDLNGTTIWTGTKSAAKNVKVVFNHPDSIDGTLTVTFSDSHGNVYVQDVPCSCN